jgi:hypothetical protein
MLRRSSKLSFRNTKNVYFEVSARFADALPLRAKHRHEIETNQKL